MNILLFILCVLSSAMLLGLLAQSDLSDLRRDSTKRALWMAGFAIMGYCMCTGLDAVVDPRFFEGFHVFKYLFLTLTPFTAMIFSLRLIESPLANEKWFIIPISIILAADLVLMLTNPFHNLMYYYDSEAIYKASFSWGPMFIYHAVVCYIISIFAVVNFFIFALRKGKIGIRVASLTILLPIGFNITYTALPKLFPMDMTALLYGCVFTAFAISLYKDSLIGMDDKQRERYLELILSNYPGKGAIIVLDEDLKVRIATKNILRYNMKDIENYEDLIGRDYLELIRDEVTEPFLEIIKNVIERAGETSPGTLIHDDYHSEKNDYSYDIVCVRYEESKPIHGGYLIVFNDVSELDRARLDAEAASVAKSAFLSNISHEIRTPMNAIIGMTQLALKEEIPDKVRLYLGNTDEAGHRLLNLINDVLDLSKIESGKMEISNADFDFDRMIRNSVNVIREQIREKHIDLEVHNSSDCQSYVHSDELRISQILVNLLSNAAKFTPHGGKITLDISLENDGNEHIITISVSDTGIGIAKENLNKLFDSFEQADKTITRQFGGTGLGLAISKKIAELMHGSITVMSEYGEGSVFTVSFPVKFGGRLDDLSDDTDVSAEDFSGKRILIVEDVDVNRLIVSSLLEDTGCTADEAENGSAAVDMVRKINYDLILMDMQMPVMDGLTATREIRAFNKDVPIIAMTANAFREDAERCIEAGMNDHISKPIDALHFLRTVSNYLKTTIK